MSKHLEPVFKILLLSLEKAGIDYWVYGGIAVAAFTGKFIRENRDVDVFVKEGDFDKTKSLLEKCNTNLKEKGVLNRGGFSRRKLEVEIDGKERLSVVPIYLRNNNAILVFGNGTKSFSNEILERVERNLSGHRFFTPSNKYIREIFLYCFRHKRNWKVREDVRKDAEVILSPEEFKKYFS